MKFEELLSILPKDLKRTCGIYAIYCISNKRVYIGQSRNMTARTSKHFQELRGGGHHNPHLQNAYNKYGRACFLLTPICNCPLEQLNEMELHYFNLFDPDDLFNIDPPGTSNLRRRGSNSNKGRVHSEEIRRKMSKAQKGIKRPPRSKEHTEKIAQKLRGKHPSEEARKNMSTSQKGRKHSEETKRKMSISGKIQKSKPEVREFYSKIKTGLKHSNEAKRKISDANKGRKRSLEEIEKTRQNSTGKLHSEETKRKMSNTRKEYCKYNPRSQETIDRWKAAKLRNRALKLLSQNSQTNTTIEAHDTNFLVQTT